MNHSIIISDASPLIIFDKIGEMQILKNTFPNIVVTPEVRAEFERDGSLLPNWIAIKTFTNQQQYEKLKQELDIGEASPQLELSSTANKKRRSKDQPRLKLSLALRDKTLSDVSLQQQESLCLFHNS